MNTSSILNLNGRDFVKGMIVAAFSAIGMTVIQILREQRLPATKDDLIAILLAAATGMYGYLQKNLFTNSAGMIATKEPIKVTEDVTVIANKDSQ